MSKTRKLLNRSPQYQTLSNQLSLLGFGTVVVFLLALAALLVGTLLYTQNPKGYLTLATVNTTGLTGPAGSLNVNYTTLIPIWVDIWSSLQATTIHLLKVNQSCTPMINGVGTSFPNQTGHVTLSYVLDPIFRPILELFLVHVFSPSEIVINNSDGVTTINTGGDILLSNSGQGNFNGTEALVTRRAICISFITP